MSGTGEGTPISTSTSFVVEDGTGLSTANSYLSVADADTYHANVTLSADWSGATAAVKENALILATQYLDVTYQGKWRGYKAVADQALAWPRWSAEDDDEYAIDEDSVPSKLKDACAELALRVVLGDSLLGVQTSPGEVSEKTIKVGPITTSTKYIGGSPPSGYAYPKVAALIRGLIFSGNSVYRG